MHEAVVGEAAGGIEGDGALLSGVKPRGRPPESTIALIWYKPAEPGAAPEKVTGATSRSGSSPGFSPGPSFGYYRDRAPHIKAMHEAVVGEAAGGIEGDGALLSGVKNPRIER